MIGLGKVAITLEHSIINVLHVDSLSYNLLSVSQLCEMSYNCLFSDKSVKVFRREDTSIVFTGRTSFTWLISTKVKLSLRLV